MAEVAICSLVRDGVSYLPAYRRQLESLSLGPEDSWKLFVVEGDSRDASAEYLRRWAAEDPRVHLGHKDVGDATDKNDRATRLARVGNAAFDLIPKNGTHTHVLWVESDLCFPADMLRRLLAREVDIVAPIIFRGSLFYDTWGFRDTAGRKWFNEAPYNPDFRYMSLVEMGSVGSCVLFRRAVLDSGIRFREVYENGLLVGMCQDARSKGFKVFADTATAILHPVDAWESQMWVPREVRVTHLDGRVDTMGFAEAGALGLGQRSPVLDPRAMLSEHWGLWRNLFDRLGTSRLEVAIRARAYPKKSYTIDVSAREPVGALGKAVRRRVLRRLGPAHIALSPSPSQGERLRTRLVRSMVRGSFRCDISIEMEPS